MSNEQQEIQFACFSLGTCLFCIDIMRIREILPSQKLSSIPTPSRYLEGVINLRGRVIPVMNLKKRFGMPAADYDNRGNLIIVKLAGQKLLALAVDEVHEVISVPVDRIRPVPEIEDAPGADCILGVALAEENFYVILGIDALLASAEVESLIDHVDA